MEPAITDRSASRCLSDQYGSGRLAVGRPDSVNDEDFVRIGLEQHQDTVADGDAPVDPVTIGISVFCCATGRDIDDGEMRHVSPVGAA